MGQQVAALDGQHLTYSKVLEYFGTIGADISRLGGQKVECRTSRFAGPSVNQAAGPGLLM